MIIYVEKKKSRLRHQYFFKKVKKTVRYDTVFKKRMYLCAVKIRSSVPDFIRIYGVTLPILKKYTVWNSIKKHDTP